MSDQVPNAYCVEWLGDVLSSPYSYRPSLAAGVVFVTLFSIQLLLHTAQAIKARRWWQLTFILGALSELLGWAARLWSHQCPYQSTPFLMQISTLIFAPAFYTAGLYYILAALIKTAFGRECSPISPNLYIYIFFTIDVVSLIVQAVGGGLASSGLDTPGSSVVQQGTDAMVAGIVFQLASILVFSALFCYVLYNARRRNVAGYRDRRVRLVMLASAISVLCVVIRNIYRTVEMLQGWDGYLITTEGWFIGFDGTLMVIAGSVFNLINPGWAEGATTWGSKSGSAIVTFSGLKKTGSYEEPTVVAHDDTTDKQGL